MSDDPPKTDDPVETEDKSIKALKLVFDIISAVYILSVFLPFFSRVGYFSDTTSSLFQGQWWWIITCAASLLYFFYVLIQCLLTAVASSNTVGSCIHTVCARNDIYYCPDRACGNVKFLRITVFAVVPDMMTMCYISEFPGGTVFFQHHRTECGVLFYNIKLKIEYLSAVNRNGIYYHKLAEIMTKRRVISKPHLHFSGETN